MPRARRRQWPGAVLHIVSRGAVRQTIFRDDRDRSLFLELLADVTDRYAWHCLTYCLMGNHYHLVVKLRDAVLSPAMHRLNGEFARLFNKRHELDGHVFQGRYWARLIQRDVELMAVARYVALNPVAAGMCARPGDWRWSAHGALAGAVEPGIVDVAEMLGHFAPTAPLGRRVYDALFEAYEEPAPPPRLPPIPPDSPPAPLVES